MMAEFTTLLCCREKFALSSVWKCLRFQYMALTVLTQSSMHNSSVVGFIISRLWLDEAELTQCLMSILYNLIIYCVYITMCWHVELKKSLFIM